MFVSDRDAIERMKQMMGKKGDRMFKLMSSRYRCAISSSTGVRVYWDYCLVRDYKLNILNLCSGLPMTQSILCAPIVIHIPEAKS